MYINLKRKFFEQYDLVQMTFSTINIKSHKETLGDLLNPNSVLAVKYFFAKPIKNNKLKQKSLKNYLHRIVFHDLYAQ